MAALVSGLGTWRRRPLAARGRTPLNRIAKMPSLFRFLVFVGLIGGLAYVAVFALANFVPHKPREISVTIPNDKFVKQPH
jgi:hypothetical protein